MKQRRYPAAKLGGFGIAAVALLLWYAERKRPLRRTVESETTHCGRNLAIAALAAVTVQVAESPIVQPVARIVERKRCGVVPRLRGPAWVRTAVALLLLDYTLYVWHVLVHRVPTLWRFHAVHHVDRDLDASTALRFHFGELTISVPWRAAQVALIGVSPAQLQLWQRLTLVSILFHHSNMRLPRRMERILGFVVMTPRLHGIHHSDVRTIRDANWSSGLTIWDRLHGTLRYDLPQEAITIGVEGCAHPGDLTLPRVLTLPFRADLQ